MSLTEKPLLAAYGITFNYSGEKLLQDFSMELDRGQITAILGPNGCGKSTLLKLISGILPFGSRTGKNPSSGQVRYNGEEFLSMDPAQRARHVAYVAPDLRAEFPLTAYEAVMMGRVCQNTALFRWASAHDADIARNAMEQCQCWGLRARELSSLSGGEKQLVNLARALVQGAKVLLLDESLSRMDLHHQTFIGKLLKKLAREGYAIALVSHDINYATEWADQCVLMKRGAQIAQGPLSRALTLENLQKLYPGADIALGENPKTGAPKIFLNSNS